MGWYVYAIKSEINNTLYVGMTQDLERRLQEHNKGKGKYTKAYIPWVLVYSEYIGDRKEARKKEKYYKSGIGKEKLKQLISAS
jgi:putative endonuclease